MGNEPTLEKRAAVPYVSIPIKATLREWGEVNALVGEVLEWLGHRGSAPAGPPFFRHKVIGGMDEKFELEVGWPVPAPVTEPVTEPITESLAGDGRVLAGAKPAGTYVVLVHYGHPDGIADTHLALVDWAAREGITLAKSGVVWQAMFEAYRTNPDDEPDLNKWETELAYLVSAG